MKEKILVVDDIPDNTKLLKAILSNLPVDITEAHSGEEALRLMENNDFALVLLDVQMPGVNGYKTAERLREMEKTRCTPIIFVTALHAEPDQIFKGYDSGAVDYLTKPFEPKVLRSKVRIFLELHRQKKLLEEEIKERQRAEEDAKAANKQKDRFLSTVALNLATPFETLLGLVRQVLQDTQNPIPPDHGQSLKRALKSGEELLSMVQELLKIGELRSGLLVPKPGFMDAHTSVLFSLGHLEEIARNKGIDLSLDIPKGVRLYADSNLFIQVIQNLISNAIKFCKAGDQITVFVPEDSPSTIGVRDTGAGIDKEKQKDLFRYESKTSTLGTHGEKGTGLGLPVSHDIMSAHGGTLEVESAPGKGSVFFARFPRVQPVILVVDDEPSTRTLIRKVLESTKADIREAKDGEEALAIMEKSPVHLAIIDLYMPAMDGFSLLANIRKNPALKELPVIVVTNDLKDETLERAFHLKADDFTTKPIEMEDLLPRVRRYI